MRSKIKWLFALFLLGVVIYGSYTLSQFVAGNEVNKKEADVIIDVGHGGCR